MSYVRLDKVRDHVENIVCTSALKNGAFVQMEGGMSDDKNSYKVAAVADVADKYKSILLHASVPRIYNNIENLINDFELKANEVGRGYHLYKDDIISISTDMITDGGTIIVGDTLVPVNASLMLAKAGGALTTEVVAFECVDLDTIGVGTNVLDLVVLRVL